MADAFGNALGNSIVGHMQRSEQQRLMPESLRDRSASEQQEFLRRREQLLKRNVDPAQADALAERWALYSINGAGPDSARALVSEIASSAGIKTGDYDEGILGRLFNPDVTGDIDLPSDAHANAPGPSPHEAVVLDPVVVTAESLQGNGLIRSIAPGLVATGEVLTELGERYQSLNPLARSVVENTAFLVDVVSGPLAFALREGIASSPIGSYYNQQKDRAAAGIAEQVDIARPGEYTHAQASAAGGGAIGLLELAAGGLAAGVKLASSLAKRIGAPRHQAKLGTSTTTAYRDTFLKAHPGINPSDVRVHHAIEQQALELYPGAISVSQMHSLENLRGIPTDLNSSLHLSTIRKEWDAFYFENPKATQAHLLQKATEIDLKYGHLFNPPVKK